MNCDEMRGRQYEIKTIERNSSPFAVSVKFMEIPLLFIQEYWEESPGITKEKLLEVSSDEYIIPFKHSNLLIS